MSEDGLIWIKHDGGPMPVPGDTVVATKWGSGGYLASPDRPQPASEHIWSGMSPSASITEYAIVTPSPSVANDPVEQPSHYKQGGIECIEAIRAALTPDEFRGYCKGNMLKYAWRERHKNGDEDLRKAAVYAGFATDKPNG